MVNILITGGSGYLSNSIANFLEKNKNLKIFLASRNRQLSKKSNHKFILINWNDYQSISKACTDKEIVIHCASPNANFSNSNFENSLYFNTRVLKLFLKACKYKGIKKFIYFSSFHVYKSPFNYVINDNTIANPSSNYGIIKHAAENTIINEISNEIEYNIIRLSNAFGPPENSSSMGWDLVINNFCFQLVRHNEITIHSNPHTKRNYVSLTNINNLINNLIIKYFKGENTPSIFNFGSSDNLSLLEVSTKIINTYEALHLKNAKLKINSKETDLFSLFEFKSETINLINIDFKSDFYEEIKKFF
jgi:UDP-glucose 4-epimerase